MRFDSTAGGIFLLWLLYSLVRKKRVLGMRATVEDAARAAFGKGNLTQTSGNAVLVWNRAAATYMRFVYSDILYANFWARVRVVTTLVWVLAGYWVILGSTQLAWQGQSVLRISWIPLLIFLGVAFLDSILLFWIAFRRKQETGYATVDGVRSRHLPTQLPIPANLEVPELPWWFLDGNGTRLQQGLFTLVRYGGALLVGTLTLLLLATGHHLKVLSILAYVFLGVEFLFLWLAVPLSLLRAAPWCGYGERRASFSLAVLFSDFRAQP